MRKPGIKNLRVDPKETKRMQSALAGRNSVKITINVDSTSLAELRRLSAGSGIPYQRLLNQVLREGLAGRAKTESRLDRLERELKQVKKEVAA